METFNVRKILDVTILERRAKKKELTIARRKAYNLGKEIGNE